MKCKDCVLAIPYKFELTCEVTVETVKPDHDCHCDAARVKRLLEQLGEEAINTILDNAADVADKWYEQRRKNNVEQAPEVMELLRESIYVAAMPKHDWQNMPGRGHAISVADDYIARARALVEGE
jgi:hypothetical protein